MSALAVRGRSIRSHILWMVFFGAILPLALVGAWLTASAIRAGKTLLHRQLDASLQAVTTDVAQRWSYRQSDLLLLAGNDVARRLLRGVALTHADSAYLFGLQREFAATIPSFSYRDLSGQVRWAASDVSPPRVTGGQTSIRVAPSTTLSVLIPTHDSLGRTIGTLDARVTIDAVVSVDSGRLTVPGSTIAIRDRGNGVVIRPISPSTQFSESGESTVDGVAWMSVATKVDWPPLDLAVGAPIGPYVTPFEQVGRVGIASLLLVALVALSLSAFLTARITAPLEQLATASAAIAQGDLDRRVLEVAGPTEIETLTASFNTMTESLRRSMDELSRRTALAAIGEFAASLAHEVRNALTSVRLDLQRAEEKLPADVRGADLVSRSVVAVKRLDATVTGALGVARSGNINRVKVDVANLLATAVRDISPMLESEGHSIELAMTDASALHVCGDPDALHQLFLNLLLNAAQALRPSQPGLVQVSISAATEDVVVIVADNGLGIPSERLARVFDPFFTTRTGGTGLGLPIARQIARAHGGDVSIESTAGVGSVVQVRLRSQTGHVVA